MYNDKFFHDGSNRHGLSRNRQKFFEQGFSNDPKNKYVRVSTTRT